MYEYMDLWHNYDRGTQRPVTHMKWTWPAYLFIMTALRLDESSHTENCKTVHVTGNTSSQIFSLNIGALFQNHHPEASRFQQHMSARLRPPLSLLFLFLFSWCHLPMTLQGRLAHQGCSLSLFSHSDRSPNMPLSHCSHSGCCAGIHCQSHPRRLNSGTVEVWMVIRLQSHDPVKWFVRSNMQIPYICIDPSEGMQGGFSPAWWCSAVVHMIQHLNIYSRLRVRIPPHEGNLTWNQIQTQWNMFCFGNS